MKLSKIAVASAIGLLASSAYADPMSWTEVAAGYLTADSGDNNVDGFELRGSLGLGNLFHVQASYVDGSEGGSFGGIDFDGYEVRAGVHPSVGDKTQAIVDLIYFNYDASFCDSCSDGNEDGWGLGFGIRHQMGDNFEVRAQADWYDGSYDEGSFSSDFTNTTVSIGGRYYWMPSLFTGVTVNLNGSEALSVAGYGGDVIRLDVGWSFGGDVL